LPQTAHAILVLSLVAALGLGLGRIRVLGVSLGVGGVLFVGLLFGHLGVTIDAHVMEFLREFGLILFVYAIGVQVGPGFVASLRRHGLVLNALAAAIVLGGAAIAWGIGRLGDIPAGVTVGLFSGATTNTPSLAAAQQAIGHRSFTCATPREVVGMANAGVGHDLLLASALTASTRARCPPS